MHAEAFVGVNRIFIKCPTTGKLVFTGFAMDPAIFEVPPHCLGHIGYAVVPWKRGRGYATQALASLLKTVRSEGLLPYVELTTDLANIASQHVITTNGGQLIERFRKPAAYGGAESLRFRIHLR